MSRTSIDHGLKKVEGGGIRALKFKPRGPQPGSRLKGRQAALAAPTVTDHGPDPLKMPFALWTREAAQGLSRERFPLPVSPRTAGRYLKRRGLTPRKPPRRAYERDPAPVRLTREYPEIARRAKRENAEIHWGDPMGGRSDHHAGRSYGRRGQTPVIPAPGKRLGR